MKYFEIATLVRFLFEKVFLKRVREISENPEDSNELIDLLENYDRRPMLIELQENFAQAWHSQKLIDQITKDYEHYLSDLKHSACNVSYLELKALESIIGDIRSRLNNPTYLDFRLLSEKFDGENNEFQESRYIWFRVGLKFAKGEIEKDAILNMSAPDIAKGIGIPEGEKYILSTLQDYDNDKNIFRSEKKMKLIIEYCQFKNISIIPDFIEKFENFANK